MSDSEDSDSSGSDSESDFEDIFGESSDEEGFEGFVYEIPDNIDWRNDPDGAVFRSFYEDKPHAAFNRRDCGPTINHMPDEERPIHLFKLYISDEFLQKVDRPDKLAKIRPLVEELQLTFKRNFNCGKKICIDEYQVATIQRNQRRRGGGYEIVDVQAHSMIEDYNANMGGVDSNDQLTIVQKNRSSHSWYTESDSETRSDSDIFSSCIRLLKTPCLHRRHTNDTWKMSMSQVLTSVRGGSVSKQFVTDDDDDDNEEDRNLNNSLI
ncbi:hypothetical protein AC249_AIPGENE7007 [Exaiptasia diaphana]|nr:hypothetical protein AC249_AIPGENE7007 [Exaiptasia diaphana]